MHLYFRRVFISSAFIKKFSSLNMCLRSCCSLRLSLRLATARAGVLLQVKAQLLPKVRRQRIRSRLVPSWLFRVHRRPAGRELFKFVDDSSLLGDSLLWISRIRLQICLRQNSSALFVDLLACACWCACLLVFAPALSRAFCSVPWFCFSLPSLSLLF